MRPVFLLTLAILSSAASAQVKLKVEIDGKAQGVASLTQRITPEGGKSVDLKMELGEGKAKVTVRSQNSYDSKGMPLRKFLETIVPGKVQKQSIVTFDSAGAQVVLLDSGERTRKDVSLVANAPRAASSEFWFLREQPAKGATVENYTFSADSLSWTLMKTTYAGRKSISVGNKMVNAHEVRSEMGSRRITTYLDDKGLPLRIEDGRMRMTRIEG